MNANGQNKATSSKKWEEEGEEENNGDAHQKENESGDSVSHHPWEKHQQRHREALRQSKSELLDRERRDAEEIYQRQKAAAIRVFHQQQQERRHHTSTCMASVGARNSGIIVAALPAIGRPPPGHSGAHGGASNTRGGTCIDNIDDKITFGSNSVNGLNNCSCPHDKPNYHCDHYVSVNHSRPHQFNGSNFHEFASHKGGGWRAHTCRYVSTINNPSYKSNDKKGPPSSIMTRDEEKVEKKGTKTADKANDAPYGSDTTTSAATCKPSLFYSAFPLEKRKEIIRAGNDSTAFYPSPYMQKEKKKNSTRLFQ